MKNEERTWPYPSQTSHFSIIPFPMEASSPNFQNHVVNRSRIAQFRPSFSPSSRRSDQRDFSALPNDVLTRIAASFSFADLKTTSLVCKSWRDALRPLREAMLFLWRGKRLKHGRGGVKRNVDKALDSFLKGVARGSSWAMVDAGLIYWEMGKKEEGVSLYRRAAELGDPAGQCNLGISCLQDEVPNYEEAVKWFHRAAIAGYVRAQYQLAVCLHRGTGTDQNLSEAAKWYLRAAKGGYARAMYNSSLCYSLGVGLLRSHRQARKWMKRAADHGHSKALFEHGLALFSEGDMVKAAVYLELAMRAGESAAAHVKNVIFQRLQPPFRQRVLDLANNWRPLPSLR